MAEASKCPECGYDLHGLPQQHECPECGLVYGRGVRVFRRTPRTSWLELCVGVVLALWIAVGFATAPWRGGNSLIVNGVAVACATVFWIIWRRHRRSCYVLLTSEQIVYREGNKPRARASLATVREAKYLSFASQVVLLDEKGDLAALLPRLEYPRGHRDRELCAAINATLEGTDRGAKVEDAYRSEPASGD